MFVKFQVTNYKKVNQGIINLGELSASIKNAHDKSRNNRRQVLNKWTDKRIN